MDRIRKFFSKRRAKRKSQAIIQSQPEIEPSPACPQPPARLHPGRQPSLTPFQQDDDQAITHAPEKIREILWNRAYDELKTSEDDEALVEAYEKILSSQLKEATVSTAAVGENDASPENEPNSINIIESDPNKRWKQMEQLVQHGLDRTKRDAKRKQQANQWLEWIRPLRKAISTGLQATPQAAVPWAGVCCALEIMTSPLTEPQKNRDGMVYVLSRIGWYWDLSQSLLDMASSNESSQPLQTRLEDQITDLYKKLLLYEMKSVCLYHRSRFEIFLRDLPKLDDWESQLKAIKDSEETLKQYTDQYSTLEIARYQQSIASSAEALKEMMRRNDTWQRHERHKEMDDKCMKDLYITDPRDDREKIMRTKGGLIQDSYTWILRNAEYEKWLTHDDNRLLWITGDAGKGKTMLVCGIIESLERTTQGKVFPFFCQAGEPRLRTALAVVRGLIWSLVRGRPALISHVRRKYDDAGKAVFNNHIAWQALSDIFRSIVKEVEPEGLIIIIDALDECTEDRSELIDLIRQLSASLNIKWIVTSRNWAEIKAELGMAASHTRLHLELNHLEISDAVRSFITHKVDSVSKKKKYDESTRVMVEEHLQANANDTFLWVALVCQELEKPNHLLYQTRRVLDMFPGGLDKLYRRMMDNIAEGLGADIRKDILAVVAIAYEPLTLNELAASSHKLAEFVGRPEDLEDTINCCDSFLTTRDGIVYVVHQSAKDFILHETKGMPEVMPSGVSQKHYSIFLSSIGMMQRELHRDLYGLGETIIMMRDISAPTSSALDIIRYSCIYWMDHLHQSQSLRQPEKKDEVVALVAKFLNDKYIYWLEAMSLLRRVSEAIAAIEQLKADLGDVGSQDLKDLVQDALRFVQSHRPIMDAMPLQLYDSALIFSPSQSKIRQAFWQEKSESIEVLRSSFRHWDACLQIIPGVRPFPAATTFAPDGRKLATLDRHRNSVLIFDVYSGELLQSIKPAPLIIAVTFHPNGQYLATAIFFQIKIWELRTGVCTRTLGWPGCIIRVEWINWGFGTSDAPRLLAMGRGWTQDMCPGSCVQLGDIETGEPVAVVEDHNREIFPSCAKLSPDGQCLAFFNDEGEVWLWNWQTSTIMHKFIGHEDLNCRIIYGLEWAPNGISLAVITEESMVLWDTFNMKQTPIQLTSHGGQITSIYYGKDRLVSTQLDDNLIKIHYVGNDSAQNTSDSYEPGNAVIELGQSLNGEPLAITRDNKLQLLNTTTGNTTQIFSENKSRKVISVVFGPNNLLGSILSDGVVVCWDTDSGVCLNQLQISDKLEAKSRRPQIDFGVPGQIAVASDKIRIWDISTGICLREFGGPFLGESCEHGTELQPPIISFSADNLVAYAEESTVAIWNSKNGKKQHQLHMSGLRGRTIVLCPNGLLVSLDCGCVIEVWNVNLCSRIMIYKFDSRDYLTLLCFPCKYDDRISRSFRVDFDADHNLQLRTVMGVFSLKAIPGPGPHESDAKLIDTTWSPQCLGVVPIDTGVWLIRDSRRVLWVPSAFARSRSISVETDRTTGTSTAAFGFGPHVLMLRFN